MTDLRGPATPLKKESNSTGKIIAGVIVAAAVCGLGAYSYETGQFTGQPKPVVADNQLPSTSFSR
jgi:hypothetical protein